MKKKNLKFTMNYKQYLTKPIKNNVFKSWTESEIINIVSWLPSKQSYGHNEINIILIKSIINIIVKLLYIIFN